ncbi:site-specific integrase [Acidobacteria bacterium AH-259-G07]|nr:site-specific integrase [Acidobacteria bacterium AH-259-G07]
MGICKWRHRGREKIVLSKIWPDGTRFRRFMPNRTVAKDLEKKIDYAILMDDWRELKQQLTKGSEENRPQSNPAIKEYSEEYLSWCRAKNRRPDFKEQALVAIKRILGDVKLKEVRRRDADRFVDTRLEEGVEPATINRGIAVLRHMLSVGVEREYIESNPLLRYRMLAEVEKALRIMTYAEYRNLIDAVAREDLVIGAYTAVLGETGMRKSEGLRLQWDHIRKVGSDRYVVTIGKTKGGRVRSVPLSPLALEWLNKLVRFIDTPCVFVDPIRRKPWKHPRGAFDKGKAKIGLDRVGFHHLRHFRGTQWLLNGVDMNTVKELLGHSSIQTTMRYVHYVETHAMKSVVEAQEKEVAQWIQSGYRTDEAK